MAPVLRYVRGRHFLTHIKYARRLHVSGGLNKLGLITESVRFNQDQPQFNDCDTFIWLQECKLNT